MRTLLITGGSLSEKFALEYIDKNSFDYIIAVDAGLGFFYHNKLRPDHIVGDFDSANTEIVKYFSETDIPLEKHKPEKDATDTELALELAIELGSTEIHILGATGRRIDHLLGNIRILGMAMEKGILCYIIDENNRLRLIDGRTEIKRSEQYGYYVSILPFTSSIEGISLKGFKYPLDNYTMQGYNALGVSNEIVDETAVITIGSGVAILIESRDTAKKV